MRRETRIEGGARHSAEARAAAAAEEAQKKQAEKTSKVISTTLAM
jgi:hypothetical protein